MLYQSEFIQREGQKVTQVILGADILKHVEPNDFVISMRSFQGGLEWCGLRGSMSSAYVALVPRGSIHAPYFAHLFKSATYVQALQATTNLVRDGQALRFSNFAQVPLPVVPMDEQVAIANFLDRETAKIDALIAEQEKLIALLAEKRQATISHAVTRGLDPDVPMKDSGVLSLGKVPEHWEVCDFRRVVAQIEQGWSPDCPSRPAEGSEWGVLKAGCVNSGVFNPSENKALPDELRPIAELAIRDGDLLMSRASGSPKLVGSTAVVQNPPERLMLSDKIFRLRLIDSMEPTFVAALFGSQPLRLQIEQAISGAEGLANNLPQASLKTFRIVRPPTEEQVEISRYLAGKISKLEAMRAAAEQSIALLRERRSALITAAVTGQIDVRQAVARDSSTAEEAPA